NKTKKNTTTTYKTHKIAPIEKIGKKIPPGNPLPKDKVENSNLNKKITKSSHTVGILPPISRIKLLPPPKVSGKKYPKGNNNIMGIIANQLLGINLNSL